jgi:hypothetical protein
MASDSERLREYERSFARAGLPLFIEDIDPGYRKEFLDELTDEMRGSFLDRTEYLRLRTRIGQEP